MFGFWFFAQLRFSAFSRPASAVNGSFWSFLSGSLDSGDVSAYRNPRGYCSAGRPHLLQHLPGQQEPHQSDHSQGHAHTDAQRYLRTHGEPSSMFEASVNTESHTILFM